MPILLVTPMAIWSFSFSTFPVGYSPILRRRCVSRHVINIPLIISFLYKLKGFVKVYYGGAREIAQLLSTLSTRPKDPGLILSP